jgi:hypothetical protein
VSPAASRWIIVLPVAALGLCVSACGGSDDSTATVGSAVGSSSSAGVGKVPLGAAGTTPAPATEGRQGAKTESRHESRSTVPDQGRSSKSRHQARGGASEQGSSPSRAPGRRSASSKNTDPPTPGFEDTSGQTDIPAFGVEASSGARANVEQVLDAYLQASGQGEWSRACDYLDGTIAGELSGLAKSSGSASEGGCPSALPRILELAADHEAPYFGAAPLSGLRIKEGAGAGFALFHGTDGNDYWAAVKVEGGQWKVLSTVPTRLGG